MGWGALRGGELKIELLKFNPPPGVNRSPARGDTGKRLSSWDKLRDVVHGLQGLDVIVMVSFVADRLVHGLHGLDAIVMVSFVPGRLVSGVDAIIGVVGINSELSSKLSSLA